MKFLSYAEFAALPEGTIFGYLPGLPHHNPGLWRKGRTWEGDDDDDGEEAGVTVRDLLPVEYEAGDEFWSAVSIAEEHRFAVYEAEDIARLVRTLGYVSPAEGREIRAAIGREIGDYEPSDDY